MMCSKDSMLTFCIMNEINAPTDRVWDIIADLDNEPKFWKGTKSIRNISKSDDMITREIVIAFKDKKCMQNVYICPKEKIEFVFTKGIIEGRKLMFVNPDPDNLEATVFGVLWDIRLTGRMRMFTNMLKGHIKNGTEIAMGSIKQAAEQRD